MIIHLDSNYRNQRIYPDASNYAIEINGTPPLNPLINDNRGCFVTDHNIVFSFQFYEKLEGIEYVNQKGNVLFLVFNESIMEFLMESVYSQNFLVGYELVDSLTGGSSVVIGSFKTNYAQVQCVLANPISSSSSGNLSIVNPSLTLHTNLLINGFSEFNQTPGQGFFQNEGINLETRIVNLTQGWETYITTIEKPYRNVTIADPGADIKNKDYLVCLNNMGGSSMQSSSTPVSNSVYTIQNIYLQGLYKFTLLTSSLPELQEGDVWISFFGQDVNYPIQQGDNFVIPQNNTVPLKIKLVWDAFEGILRIQTPGNLVQYGEKYKLYLERNPEQTIEIVAISLSLSIRVDKPLHGSWIISRTLVYFLQFFLAIPFYSVLVAVEGDVWFLEDPGFAYVKVATAATPVISIYQRIGLINFTSFFPNLQMPLSNLPFTCYNVGVSSISIPNLPLCGTNFLLADFPYVFITFGNLTHIDQVGTYSIGALASNVPGATYATFVCPIANIRNPDIVKYVVVKSYQIIQVKINFSENLQFRVFLPNGEVLRFAKRYEFEEGTNNIIPSPECTQMNSLTSGDTKVYSLVNNFNISCTFQVTACK